MSAARPPEGFTRAVAKPRLEERVRERGCEADNMTMPTETGSNEAEARPLAKRGKAPAKRAASGEGH